MDELVKRLGFQVLEKHGYWTIQVFNEEGKIIAVQPCLDPKVWKMWQLLVSIYTPIKA